REDVRRARAAIEDAAGSRCSAHRAAEWSIRHPADPALRVLSEEGFACDASATPVPPLGRADNPLGPYRVEENGAGIVEIPPLTGRGFGRRLPVGGGWPFRTLPEERVASAERAYRSSGLPAVFTFHPWEFDPEHPRMVGLPPLLRTVHFFKLGVLPGATAGYSLGNYAALVVAQAVSYDDALEVLIAVERETERLGIRGSMGAVVGARREAVEEICAALRDRGRPVWIGNVNASTQFVLTGEAKAVEEALALLTPKSLSVLPLPMSWPIHSPLMARVAEAVAPVVAACSSIRDPAVPYYGPDGKR